MRCSKCGAENSQSARFCIKCGEGLTPPVQKPVPPASLGSGSIPPNGMGGNGQIPPRNVTPPPANFGNGFAAGNAAPPISQVIPDYNPSLDYKPLGMWAYFGYDILFAIPLVGLIVLIIFACSASNVNLRNYARSKFCLFIIIFLLVLLFMAMGGGLAALSSM